MPQPMLARWSCETRSARKDRADRGAEVLAGDREAVARTAVVELAAVDERTIRVEQEEVGRARRRVRLRDLLGLVEQVGEGVAGLSSVFRQALGRVLGVLGRIVRADRHDRELGVGEVASQPRELRADVFTYGQWRQMNMTSSARLSSKSRTPTVRPVTTSANSKSGALVPSGQHRRGNGHRLHPPRSDARRPRTRSTAGTTPLRSKRSRERPNAARASSRRPALARTIPRTSSLSACQAEVVGRLVDRDGLVRQSDRFLVLPAIDSTRACAIRHAAWEAKSSSAESSRLRFTLASASSNRSRSQSTPASRAVIVELKPVSPTASNSSTPYPEAPLGAFRSRRGTGAASPRRLRHVGDELRVGSSSHRPIRTLRFGPPFLGPSLHREQGGPRDRATRPVRR